MQKKLILISGSPCVGKTAAGTRLFESFDNSAYLKLRKLPEYYPLQKTYQIL